MYHITIVNKTNSTFPQSFAGYSLFVNFLFGYSVVILQHKSRGNPVIGVLATSGNDRGDFEETVYSVFYGTTQQWGSGVRLACL